MTQPTKTVTDKTFQAEVLESDRPVLVDYWAEWCGPCRMIGPLVEESATQYADRLTVAKLNVDENPVTPTRYSVRGIPTLMLFKGGLPIATHVGSLSKGQLQAFINKHPGSRRVLPLRPTRDRPNSSAPGSIAIARLGCISARKVSDPIGLPGVVVIRERLLPAGVIVIDLVPQVAHLDRSAFILVLSVELPVMALEASDHGWGLQFARGAADPIDRPLPLLQIKCAQGQTGATLRRHVQLINTRDAAKIERHAECGRKLFPLGTADASCLEAPLPRRPASHEVVEIVHPPRSGG